MRKLLVLLSLVAISAFAEPSFQQVEGLIEQKQYQSAVLALEQIIPAHPNSAKAFYAMAQAQAGVGNLAKAQFALAKARAIDPELKFATASNIQSLEQAITPQAAKIEVVTESHFWRNFFLFLLTAAGLYFIYTVIKRKDEDEGSGYASTGTPPSNPPDTPQAKVDRVNSAPLKPTTTATASIATSGPAVQQPMYTPAPAATQPTVVNNHYGSSNDGLLTGVLIGNMLSNHDHHTHDTTIIRETVREVPALTRDTSWDDTPAPRANTRDTSWDDTPSTSSRSSSSWDSDSSSSSSWSSSSSSDSSWGSSDSSSSSSSDW